MFKFIKMPCINRIIYSQLKLPFPDRKHFFYAESACGNASDGDLCRRCLSKPSEHGIISEAYNQKSHIFDSPWYHKSVKAYGSPEYSILEKAMEAQKKAREGKRVSVLKTEENAEKRVQPVRVKKTITVDSGVKILPLNKMVESMDEPLEVDSIFNIKLKGFIHNKIKFWRDDEKVYECLANGQKGSYIGLWDGKNIQNGLEDSDID